jgi:hypothetical protein
VCCGIPTEQYTDILQTRRNLLQHLRPLTADSRFEVLKARHVPARSRKAGNDVAFDGFGCLSEDNGDITCQPMKLRDHRVTRGNDRIWRGLHQFCRELDVLLCVACAPAIIDAEVATIFPTQLAQRLEQGSDAYLPRLVSRTVRAEQDADAPRTLDLLRAPLLATLPLRQ